MRPAHTIRDQVDNSFSFGWRPAGLGRGLGGSLTQQPLVRILAVALAAVWFATNVPVKANAQDYQGGPPQPIFPSVGSDQPSYPGDIFGGAADNPTAPVPVPPCGMNGLEAQAWAGPAGNSLLGMIGRLANQGCGIGRPVIQDPCLVEVGFEPVSAGVGPARQMHAVVILTSPGFPPVAFEANPTGSRSNWGTLISRIRNLATEPLKPGYFVKTAGRTQASCAQLMPNVTELEAVINRSMLPYQPAPELIPNGVNSNSFAYWLITRLGLQPPSVNFYLEGSVPGYNGAIQ